MNDFERFSAAFAYDPETGVLTWKIYQGGGAPRIGEVAGTYTPKGYIDVRLNRKGHRAHRVAWLLATGAWPVHTIDHINGVHDDNRIANLRDVPLIVNQRNLFHASPRGELGFKGVWRATNSNRYLAVIGEYGVRRRIGSFLTVEEAASAYAQEAAKLKAELSL